LLTPTLPCARSAYSFLRATPAHSKIRSRRWLTELVVQSGFAELRIFRLAGGNEGGAMVGSGLPALCGCGVQSWANAIDLKSEPVGDGALLETGFLAGLPDPQALRSLLGPCREARRQADRWDRRQGEADTNCLRSTAHRRQRAAL